MTARDEAAAYRATREAIRNKARGALALGVTPQRPQSSRYAEDPRARLEAIAEAAAPSAAVAPATPEPRLAQPMPTGPRPDPSQGFRGDGAGTEPLTHRERMQRLSRAVLLRADAASASRQRR